MDFEKLLQEISKLTIEEQKMCAEYIKCFFEASKFSHTKGFTEEERIEWLSKISDAVTGIINLASDTSEYSSSEDYSSYTEEDSFDDDINYDFDNDSFTR